MFTGIVEGLGIVLAVRQRRDTLNIRVRAPFPLDRVPIGGSVAVDGVCLTVANKRGHWFEADLGPETLTVTTLGRLQPAARVHLERPLRAADPLGGHLVAGHVEGVGRVVERRAAPGGRALSLAIEVPRALARHLLPKGSIAVDGVSLTVNRIVGRRFAVTLIPHTLAVTHLGERRAGDRVNIETDPVVRQVARLVDAVARRKKKKQKRKN